MAASNHWTISLIQWRISSNTAIDEPKHIYITQSKGFFSRELSRRKTLAVLVHTYDFLDFSDRMRERTINKIDEI